MSTIKKFKRSSLGQKNIITNRESVQGGHHCNGTTTSKEVWSTLGVLGPIDTVHDWRDEGCCGEE